jgi:hypothetical protein
MPIQSWLFKKFSKNQIDLNKENTEEVINKKKKSKKSFLFTFNQKLSNYNEKKKNNENIIENKNLDNQIEDIKFNEKLIFSNFINPIQPIPSIIIRIFEFILKNCKYLL